MSFDINDRPEYDNELVKIADYVSHYTIDSPLAMETARYCLLDSIGCAILALSYPECTKLLGPVVPGITVNNGARVLGTAYVCDPVTAAFNNGALIRWLDFNDTWLAAEWGHPSDNLATILSVADYLSRSYRNQGSEPILMKSVLEWMIKAHEIQGIFALKNSFNRVGLDHVILVKTASTAIATHLLGGTHQDIIQALSQVFVDGQSLRTYRHAPNTGSRKSWAAGDACARAVTLALMTLRGEMGYPSALTAKQWGFYDVSFKGKSFSFERPFTSYVMENVLFKIAYPAEFHAQTAVEAAIRLHAVVRERLNEIQEIRINTHESAIRIISKQGALHNPADRDHCLQYMVAIGLIYGDLTADHYESTIAANPLIDALRLKMQVNENTAYSRDYLDSEKRSIANDIQIFFHDGSRSEKVVIEYPIGHRLRREEGIPLLFKKAKANLSTLLPTERVSKLIDLFHDAARLEAMPVDEFVDLCC